MAHCTGQNPPDNCSQLPVKYVPLKISPCCPNTFPNKSDSVGSEIGVNPEVKGMVLESQ